MLKRYGVAAALAASTCLASPVLAQVAAADDALETATNSDETPKSKVRGLKAAVPDQDPADASDIVVTGTRIIRPNMESNAPIAVVDQSFLRERGLSRIEDALSQIPQVTPIMGIQGNDWTSGRAGINLRRLGAGRTLTLLNGQRNFNDVNIVPGALIERVDILTGGASAVYGSDAIAGVVNFVIKRRFNGIVLDAEASGFQHRNDNDTVLDAARDAGYRIPQSHFFGGGNFFASLAAGKDLFDKRVNISGFVTLREAKPVRLFDLDTSACPLRMNPINATVFENDRWACGGSEYSPYGYFNISGQDYSTARDGSRTFRSYSQDDSQYVGDNDFIQRGEKAINAGGFVTAELFSGIKFDGSFLYTFSRQDARDVATDGYYTDNAQVNCDNPLLGAQQASLLCGAAAGTTALSAPFATYLWRKDYSRDMRPRFWNWRGSAMLSGRIVDNIRFEASYQRSRDIFRNATTNVWPADGTLLNQGLQVRNVNGVPTCLSKIDGTNPQCVPIDAFSANAQIGEDAWSSLMRTGNSWQQNDLDVVNVAVSGTLEAYGLKSPLAESGIGFALVGEQRNVRSQSRGSGGWSNWTAFDGRARVREVAAELEIPLIEDKPFIKELSVNGAYRLSDYTTYEKLVHTWKAEASYAPFDGLRFRGSYNRAVRVPVLERLEGENRYPNTFAFDLCAPPAAGSNLQRYTFEQCSIGMTRAQYDALTTYTGCNTTGGCPAVLINGGNPNLQPERGRSYTAGVVIQPRFAPGLSGSVDWYAIRIDGAFEWARWWQAFDQCYGNQVEFWCGFYKRDAQTGQLREIDARYSNSGATISNGLDFSLTYALDPKRLGIDKDIGAFNLNFNGTLATKLDRQFAPNTAIWSCVGYHGFNCGEPSPKWRHVAGLNWKMPWANAGLGFTWRYIGPTLVSKLSSSPTLTARPSATNPDTYPLVRRISPFSYFDIATNVALTPKVEVRFNVQNLFDKDPPLIGLDQNGAIGQRWNTYPATYQIRGRTLRVGLTARY